MPGTFFATTLVAAVLTVTPPGMARPLKISVITVQAEGMELTEAVSLGKSLDEHVVKAGAEVVTWDGARLEDACLRDPACVQGVAARLGVQGLLVASVQKVGLTLQIDMHTYGAATGERLLETTTVLPVREVPESATLRGDLGAALDAVRASLPAEPAAAPEASAAAPPPAGTGVAAAEEQASTAGPSWTTYAGWGAVGLGAALLAGSAVPGLMALDLNGKLEQACSDPASCAGHDDDIAQLDTLSWSSLAMQVGALVVAGAGGTLLVVGALDGGEEARTPRE